MRTGVRASVIVSAVSGRCWLLFWRSSQDERSGRLEVLYRVRLAGWVEVLAVMASDEWGQVEGFHVHSVPMR